MAEVRLLFSHSFMHILCFLFRFL